MDGSVDGVALRTLGEDELTDLIRLEALVWGWTADAARARWYAGFLEPGHTVGAFHGGELIAVHGMTRLRLTVPGGAVVGTAGITCLSVHPLFRNRGLMALLTSHDHELTRREGRDWLGASIPHHSWTHHRFGYGVATRYANVTLVLDGQRALRGVVDDGRMSYVDKSVALELLQKLSTRLSGSRNGWVPRHPAADRYKYSGTESAANGYSPAVFAVHRAADGEVDGFLAYRQTAAGSDTYGKPTGTLRVLELFGTTAAVEAQLWQHCLANPLVTHITATRRPPHDPVATRLPEPRSWRQTIRDDMVLRFFDIPRALSARRYSREDTVILDIPDADGPARRYRLTGGLDGATCHPVDRAPDLTLPHATLASAYLGDTTLIDLAASGDILEHTPNALRRASAMFSWSPTPWIQDSF